MNTRPTQQATRTVSHPVGVPAIAASVTMSSSPNGLPTGGSSSDPIHYCSLCSKPFTVLTSYRRHVAYCRRKQDRPRKRPRSCRECSQAKAKCSFEAPCSRCADRGLECVYDQRITLRDANRPTVPILAAASPGRPRNADHHHPKPSASAGTDDHLAMLDFGSSDVLDLSDFPQFDDNLDGGNLYGSNLDGVVPFGVGLGDHWLPMPKGIGQLGVVNSLLSSRLDSLLNVGIGDWRVSPSKTVSDLGTLEAIRRQDPISQHGASLIMQAFRSIPDRMLRRETFPPFIHPQWHRPALPEPLVVCMTIAHMFATGNQEIRPFLWRSIKEEQIRILREFDNLSMDDILAAAQAQTVYLLMRIVDGSMEPAGWNGDVLLLGGLICERFQELSNEPFCLDEASAPSPTWTDWIFAESRRRTACAWYLLNCIVSLQTGVSCHVMDHFRALPLPSSKVQWEARSPEDWAEALQLDRISSDDSLRTVGNLHETQGRSDAEPSDARRLDAWNARNDQLGTLMSIAASMIRH